MTAFERVPNPPLPLSKAAIDITEGFTVHDDGSITGTRAIRACEENAHIYAERPGWCQCGEHFWDEDPLTSADIPEANA